MANEPLEAFFKTHPQYRVVGHMVICGFCSTSTSANEVMVCCACGFVCCDECWDKRRSHGHGTVCEGVKQCPPR